MKLLCKFLVVAAFFLVGQTSSFAADPAKPTCETTGCPAGQVCCNKVCSPGAKCCKGPTVEHVCAEQSASCCQDVCYNKFTDICCSDFRVIPNYEACGGKCCKQEEECCGTKCCDKGEHCCSARNECAECCSDEQCNSDKPSCVDGNCEKRCNSDAECPEGQKCDLAHLVCVPKPSPTPSAKPSKTATNENTKSPTKIPTEVPTIIRSIAPYVPIPKVPRP